MSPGKWIADHRHLLCYFRLGLLPSVLDTPHPLPALGAAKLGLLNLTEVVEGDRAQDENSAAV